MRKGAALVVLALVTLTACGSPDGVLPAAENQPAANAAAVSPDANAAVTPGSGVTSEATAVRPNTAPIAAEPAAVQPVAAAEAKLARQPGAAVTPCMTQDGKALAAARLRATGTEPFWSAIVEGRCVTYSNPDDQGGTRVWTRVTPARIGGSWSGALGGRPFELRVRPDVGCSDGMSDKEYPLAAELMIGDERRSGCAEPLSG